MPVAAFHANTSELRPIVRVDVPKEHPPTTHEKGFSFRNGSAVIVLVNSANEAVVHHLCGGAGIVERPAGFWQWKRRQVKTSPTCVGISLAIDGAPR
jgi:hypothetical protein